MEYLLMAALFCLGWTLAKMDVRGRIRPIMEQVATEYYTKGVAFGVGETLKAISDDTSVGFKIPQPTSKKD